MVRLEYVLLATGVCLLTLGRLIEDSECSGGVTYEGFCFDSCPSGFVEYIHECKPMTGTRIFNLNSLEIIENKEFLDFAATNSKDMDKDFPILTSNLGYFFKKSSKISFSGPQVSSYKMTISMFLNLYEDGDLISDSDESLKLFTKNSIFSLEYLGKPHIKFHLSGGNYHKWHLIHVKIAFSPSKIAEFYVKFGQTEFYSQFYITDFPNLNGLTWTIGNKSKSGQGYTGFLHKAEFYNNLIEPGEVPNLEICNNETKVFEACQTPECLESACRHKDSRFLLTFCLDYPKCLLSSAVTPLFYQIVSNYYARVPETQKSVLLYYFDTDDYKISEMDYPLYNLVPKYEALPEPRGAYMRGKYLDSINNYYITDPGLALSLSPTFFFWVKLETPNYLPILSKNSIYRFYISNSGHYVFIKKWLIFEDDSISQTTWSLIKYSFFYNATLNITTLKISVNEVVKFLYDASGYLYNESNVLSIGYDNGNIYKGWIYLFGYCDSNTILQLNTVRATECIFNSETDSKCVINCNMTSYFDNTGCKLCPVDSLSCKSNSDCGSCFENACSTCKYSEASYCTTCSGYTFESYCLSACPILFEANSTLKSCNRSPSTWIDVKLDDSTAVAVNPALFSLRATGYSAVHMPSRGYLFVNSSNYQSNSSFYIHPLYTYQIWVKFIAGSSLEVGFEGTGLKIIMSQISYPITSVNTPVTNLNNWSHFKVRLYSISGFNTSTPNYLNDRTVNIFEVVKDNSFLGMGSTNLVKGSPSATQQTINLSSFFIKTDNITWAILYKIRYNIDGTFYDLTPNEPLCGTSLYCFNCGLSQFIYSNQCFDCPAGCLLCNNTKRCTYYEPGCYKLLGKCFNPCPEFYSFSGQNCVINSVNKMIFVLNTLNGTVPDSIKYETSLDSTSKNAYPSLDYLKDPLPSSNRGFFFGRTSSTKMLTSDAIIFSPEFFFGIWVMPQQYSGIAQKGNIFSLFLTESGVKISITSTNSISYVKSSTTPIPLSKWVFIGISIYFDNSATMTASSIFTNAVKQTFTLFPEVLVDVFSLLVIGEANSNYFVGWIYKVIYSGVPWMQSDIDTELGTCSGCSCPATLNNCLPTCYYDQFFALGECKNCEGGNLCKALATTSLCFDSESCTKCDNFKTCKLCSESTCKTTCDPSCKVCASSSVLHCELCADTYYRYLGLCLKNCPDLTTIVGSECVFGSALNLEYNFHTSANTVSDSLNKLTFEASSKLYTVNRGWYTELVTSSGNLSFAPYPSLFLWIKLSAVGEIISKKSSFGIVEFGVQLNVDYTLKIFENTSKGFNSGSDIYVNGIQPFSWKYFAIVYEGNAILSKRYFYVDSVLIDMLSLVEKYLIPAPNYNFEIGNNNPMFLHLFRYSISFSNADFPSSYNTGLSCLYPKAFTNCLWDCPIHTYYDGLTCKPCLISSACAGPLYSDFITCFTYLNNYCVIGCPTFHTNITSTCTLSSENSLDFIFNTFDGSIPSTNNLFTFVNPGSTNYPNSSSTDPKPAFKRGFYFNGSWMQTSSDLEFSNTFTLEFWANFDEFRSLLIKSKLDLAIANSGITIKMKLMDDIVLSSTVNGAIALNKWNFIGAVLTASRIIKIHLGKNLIGEIDIGGYFIDALAPLKFGGQESNSFRGWIYRIKYSAIALDSAQFIINTDSAPDLWNCRYGFLNISNTCIPCKKQCNCRRSTDCTLCQSENCELCSSYSSTCTKCFEGFEYFIATDECKPISARCQELKYYLNECNNCKTGFSKYENEACLLYCSHGDTLNDGECSRNEANVMSFVLNKVNLPFESNGFELILGTRSSFWPDYDTYDPIVSYQRGFYFEKSLLLINNTQNIANLELANWQTFEIYFFPMEGKGSLISYFSDQGKVISVIISGNSLIIAYKVTDTISSSTLSLVVPVSLNTWNRLMWTLQPSFKTLQLKAYIDETLIGTVSAFNSVFDQPLDNTFFIGSYKKTDYFEGYVYSFSIDNYLKTPPNSYSGCKCPYCTTNGDCLVDCGPKEYFQITCKKCPGKCNNGCGQGETCSVYKSPLCASFNYLNESCLLCVDGTKSEVKPCECVEGALFNKDQKKCECQNNELIYQEKCNPCYRYLTENEVNSYFLDTFIQVFFEFSVPIAPVKCTDLFTTDTLEKFGQSYECEFNQNYKSLTVTLGVGFTLYNERISLNLVNLQGSKRECGHPFQEFNVLVNYISSPPSPEAFIKVLSSVNINCQDLFIDGSKSKGQVLKLEYKWEFISNIPELQSYPRDYSTSPYIKISNTQLIAETLTIVLTVRNKFMIENSVSTSITLTNENILVIEFDKLIDYSCLLSKTCQFFIKNVETCEKDPIFEYAWTLKTENLGLNETSISEFWGYQSAPDSITIPENFFPCSEIEFSVTVTEQTAGISASDSLAILIKSDPIDIILDRAPGPISEDEDLIITPSIPTNKDPNTKLSFEWKCFLDSVSCTFPYEKNNLILTILKTYIKSRLFNKCVLTLYSTTNITRRFESKEVVTKTVLEFECKIVPGKVPRVNLYKSDTMTQPKFITGQSSQNFEIVIKDRDLNEFSFEWKIDKADSSVFLSPVNQVMVGIDLRMLVKGYSYKLSVELVDSSKQSFLFSYDFTINSPPKLGICGVSPDTGEEQNTLFSISCVDWKDTERDYPLSYSFGTYIRDLPYYFVSISLISSFSTKLAFTGPKIILFSRVIDSTGDFIELLSSVNLTVSNSFDQDAYAVKASDLLKSSSTPTIPNTILNIALLTLNRDYYTLGEFKPQSNDSIASMNNVFTLLTTSLESFIADSIPSTETVASAASILQEMSQNPSMVSDENFNSTSCTIFDLLDRTKNIGLTVESAKSLLTSIDTLANVESNTLYNNTSKIRSIENLLTGISDGLKNSLTPNKPTEIKSGSMSLKLYLLDKSNKAQSLQLKVGGVKSTLPAELLSKFSDLSKVVFFTGYSESIIETNKSTPTTTFISISSKDQSEIFPIYLENSKVIINIPVFNTEVIKEPSCFYLNSTKKWDKTGCSVLEVGENFISCECNHLSLFSSGEGVEGGGFVPSSNIEQTGNLDALANLNAKSAIGFYFVSIILGMYLIIGGLAWKKDSKDIQGYLDEVDILNARQIANEDRQLSQGSMVNEGHVHEENEVTPRVQRDIAKKIEEEKQKTKTGFRVIIEEHRLLNIFFHHDPFTFRFTRCSLLFLLFTGKMYFIGLFYESDAEKNKVKSVEDALIKYALRDVLVMIYSIGIVTALDLFLILITKIKPIDITLPREALFRNIRVNKIKRILALVLCIAIMGFYCWSIALFALNLEYSVSMKWVISTAIGIFSDLTVTPLIKLIVKGLIISKIVLYLKLRNIKRKVIPMDEKKIDDDDESDRSNIGFTK